MDLLGLATILAAALDLGAGSERKPCVPRRYEFDSVVCVCNATYCDTLEPVLEEEALPTDVFLHFLSTRDGLRLRKAVGSLSWKTFPHAAAQDAVRLRVDHKLQYQEVLGFGAAMTDATGINVAALSQAAQENLIRSLFSSEGLAYSLVRVPMGATDFSPRNYTFDDGAKDPELRRFQLQEEDVDFKIPFLTMAAMVSAEPPLLVACPWRAPGWMLAGDRLRSEYYQVWANYYITFLKSYAKAGLLFWGVSTQSEPSRMGWSPGEQGRWLGEHLGPALDATGFSALRVLVLEDSRSLLPAWLDEMLEDAAARDYADVVAVHWYQDSSVGPGVLDDTHGLFPDKPLLYTEASFSREQAGGEAVHLGSWERAESYASSCIEVCSHWSAGWMEWNMALDTAGGLSWSNQTADASIIVNATGDEFLKQPMFYAIAHFSKFVPRGSRRIALLSNDPKGIESIAFKTPSDFVVIVLLNRKETEVHTVIDDPEHGHLDVSLPARSIHTLIYNNLHNEHYEV